MITILFNYYIVNTSANSAMVSSTLSIVRPVSLDESFKAASP